MKKWLLILFIILNMGAQTQVRFSTVPFTVTPVADYVPATVQTKSGAEGESARLFKVGIYLRTGTDTGNLVTNGTSSAISGSETLALNNGTFSGCSALTPGSRYIVTVLCNGYISFARSGATYKTQKESATYDSFPASCNLSTEQAGKMFEFVIKNAAGQTLLSFGDMTSTDTASVSANELYGNDEDTSITCATL